MAKAKTKTFRLFDPELGIYEIEVPDHLKDFPLLVNEIHVLGLSLLQEEYDDSFAVGYERPGGAVSPWFHDLKQLEQHCLQPGSREEMRRRAALLRS